MHLDNNIVCVDNKANSTQRVLYDEEKDPCMQNTVKYSKFFVVHVGNVMNFIKKLIFLLFTQKPF